VKKPLTNALIYFAIAGVVYILILLSPDEIGFYGLLLFYLIHFPGAILVSLFSKHNIVEGSRHSHYFIGFVLITVNATLVFLISWIARMRVQPNNA